MLAHAISTVKTTIDATVSTSNTGSALIEVVIKRMSSPNRAYRVMSVVNTVNQVASTRARQKILTGPACAKRNNHTRCGHICRLYIYTYV